MDFTAPGPGSWLHDVTHYPQAVPQLHAKAIVDHFERGFADAQPVHGSSLLTLAYREVNGFIYTQAHPVGAPLGAKTPPSPVMWLLLRLHPQIRERAKVSRELLRAKAWRADLTRWDEEVKPRHVKRYLALLDVDVKAASNDQLAEHIAECHVELEKALYVHGRYTTPALFPIALFAARVQEWTGASVSDALRDVHGQSAISRGSIPELDAVVTAIRASADAQRTLAGTDAGEVLATLEARSDVVGETMREFLRHVGYRLVSGYDFSQQYARETPHVLVDSIRSALAKAAKASKTSPPRTSALRERVPAEHHAEFDELLEEANVMNRLRDERALYCDIWISGILRRAVLEAGRRLVERGALAKASDLVEATVAEMTELLRNDAKGPSADTLADRARARAALNETEPPPFLGAPPGPMPPLSVYPKALRVVRQIEDVVVNGLYMDAIPDKAGGDAIVIRGLGVSKGTYEGRACVIREAKDLDRVVPGDVLVASATSPAYSRAIAVVGAIVTDRGGALTHAAIMTRELGIPGVVGTREGTRKIKDGARVRVDGTSGEVTVLS
jgi:phosphohistidine swiveling domain-containing protein